MNVLLLVGCIMTHCSREESKKTFCFNTHTLSLLHNKHGFDIKLYRIADAQHNVSLWVGLLVTVTLNIRDSLCSDREVVIMGDFVEWPKGCRSSSAEFLTQTEAAQ